MEEPEYYTYENGTSEIDRDAIRIDTQEEKITTKNKKSHKKLLIILPVVILIVIAMVVIPEMVKRSRNTFVITDEWIGVRYLDYYGDVSIQVGLKPEYYKSRAEEIFGSRPEAEEDDDYVFTCTGELIYALEFEIEDERDLKIGDIATVTVVADQKKLKELGIYVKTGTYKVKVEGRVYGE